MNFLFSLFFGAGAATFIYTKLARRTGYGNTRDAFLASAVIFVIVTIMFYSIFSFLPK
jgi:hypothetical protein